MTVSPAAATFEAIGRTVALTAALAPSTAAGTITWRSADAAIATVTGSGTSATVTAVAPGTTEIIAAVGTIEGRATVTVPAVPQEMEAAIPATGGTLTLDVPGHPFDGFALTVPAGAFDGATTWRVLTDTTPARAFPAGATVAGPGLAIAGVTGLTRQTQLLTLRIPVTPQPGHTTAIALVDPATGAFDLLPLVARDAGSVTVRTRHLDPALFGTNADAAMPGPRALAVRSPGRPWPQMENGTITARLYRLQLPNAALQNIAPLLGLAQHAWPVAEDGSAAFPTGHGSALVSLTRAAATLGINVAQLVRARGADHFYADTAALTTVMITAARQRPHEQALQALQGMTGMTKPARDSLTTSNLMAALALTGEPQLLLMLPTAEDLGDPGRHAWGLAIGMQQGTIQFLDPTAPGQIRSMTAGATGFTGLASRTLASDAVALPRDVVLAVPPSLLPQQDVHQQLITMAQAITADPAARHGWNHTLATQAGLARVPIQLRPSPVSDFVDVDQAVEIVSGDSAELRLAGSSASLRLYDPTNGAEVHRAAPGASISVRLIPGVQDAEDGATVAVHAVAVDVASGRQLVPFHFSLSVRRVPVRSPNLRLERDTVHLRDSSLVALTATLTDPPDDGYRIVWQWGDGTETTVHTDTPAAEHLYTRVGTFRVVATLRTAEEPGQVLAVDSTLVITYPLPYWFFTSFEDPKGFLDTQDGQQSVFRQFLTAPATGLLMIWTRIDSATSSIYLDVHPDGITFDELECCRRSVYWRGGGMIPNQAPVMFFGTNPRTTAPFGPYFAAFSESFWTQSTPDLTAGTVLGQSTVHATSCRLPNGTLEACPVNFFRFQAARDADGMTGVIELYRVRNTPVGIVLDLDIPTAVFPFTARRKM